MCALNPQMVQVCVSVSVYMMCGAVGVAYKSSGQFLGCSSLVPEVSTESISSGGMSS